MPPGQTTAALPPFPPVAFHFGVIVDGFTGANEGSFQEVSGLSVKITPMEIKEGGENRFIRRLPTPPKYENLVLRRGMLIGSQLTQWVRTSLTQFTFTPAQVTLNLLDGDGSILATWKFQNAYPVGLKINDLKSTDNNVVVESLELAFEYFEQTL
ncbi:phage tail protein [Chitinophaga agrisoli]|uniref:Phage tail protein n=1 Tax=Chitinophaga agrisoli TaxID=2607653 RepID=A0A5B2VME4_9BACT|nr:phage tail protein [Chitinophaga agrisoli]KAA2240004.1 phage tail protein [Chitinophaga agrisoli]